MGRFKPGFHAFASEMAEFDLTALLGQYLDKHLVFPLLEFISVQKIYNEEEMLGGKLDLLKSTNMVDFAMDVHKTLYKDQEVPKYLTEKRREVVDELKRQQEQTEKIIKRWPCPFRISFKNIWVPTRRCGHALQVR